MTFSDLKIHPRIIQNLERLGYREPTPIQDKAIPAIIEDHDILGIAQTGTGKTAAFTLPILDRLLQGSESKITPKVLILAPTRELCLQIHESTQEYATGMEIRSCAIYGGVGQGAQIKAIKEGAEILVATPGRLLDLLEQKVLRLTGIEFFVIDEADRMLDLGFLDDIKDIVGRLPPKRQSLLFSATMPEDIKALASKLLKSPKVIEIAPQSTVASNIDQKIIFCKRDHKFQLLKKIIKEGSEGLVLVFTRTKNIADNVVEYLAQNRIASRGIHGDKDQGHRETSIKQFSEGSIRILVATDLVSRGIDVDDLGLVINFDLPLDPESYVHRVGRTARAGKTGRAVSFCEESQKGILDNIERLIQQRLKTEKFEGKSELLKFKTGGERKVTPPTPGRSQEKPLWYDHSKRQKLDEKGKKIHVNPAFKNKKKKKK